MISTRVEWLGVIDSVTLCIYHGFLRRGDANVSKFKHVPKWFCPNMAINELRDLPSDGPLQLATVDGGTVLIPEPSVHTGKRPVKIRVLSFQARHGVVSNILITNASTFDLMTPNSALCAKLDKEVEELVNEISSSLWLVMRYFERFRLKLP